VAVGEHGIIVYSDDAGKTWRQAEVPVSVTLTGIYFATPAKGWAVGHDGVILHTADGGKKWATQFDGNQANKIVLADAQGRLDRLRTPTSSAPAPEPSEALRQAENNLEDAKAGAKFGPSRPLFDVWFRNESEGYVVGSFGQMFKTTDGGAHWTLPPKRIDNPDGFHYNALAALPSGALAIPSESGKVFFSKDGGAAWETLNTGYSGQLYGVLGLPSPDGKEALLAFGFGGHIFRSDDDGKTWQELNSGTKKTVVSGLVSKTQKIILITQDGHLLRSDDQGRTFKWDSAALAPSVVSMSRGRDDGQLVMAGAAGVLVSAPTAVNATAKEH
jgi:photosystem II stability/assembly factor-like uncharacterized protein